MLGYNMEIQEIIDNVSIIPSKRLTCFKCLKTGINDHW